VAAGDLQDLAVEARQEHSKGQPIAILESADDCSLGVGPK